MANMRSHQPSIYEKICWQPHKHDKKYGLNIGVYINSGCFMERTLKRTVVLPAIPVEAPSEKRARVPTSVVHMVIIAAVTMTAPLKRVKLLIQNQNEMLKTGRLSQPYKGITHCFTDTIKREGFHSLWRGNTASIMIYVGTKGLKGLLRDYSFISLSNLKSDKRDGYWKWFAGGPSHLHKGVRQFNGLIDVYRKTLKSDGIAGLYRGFGVSCIGCILACGVSLGLQDSLKPLFDCHSGSKFATYPFETVGKRMMMRSGEATKYKNSWDAFAHIIKNEGAKSLFKGFGLSILHFYTLLVVVSCSTFF